MDLSSSKQAATESAAEVRASRVLLDLSVLLMPAIVHHQVPPPAKKAKTTTATKDATGVASSKTKAVATKSKGTKIAAS